MTTLSTSHANQLFKESGISELTSKSAGVFTVTESEAFKLIGIRQSGIAFPFYDLNRNIIGYRIKLDKPLKNENEKIVKYLTSKNSDAFIYFVPSDLPKLKESTILGITEGEKKCLKGSQDLQSLNIPLISITGCHMYRRKSQARDEIHPILKELLINKKEVILFVDSDYFSNKNVAIAYNRLSKILVKLDITVSIIDLRLSAGNEIKVGLDDFLLQEEVKSLNERISKPYATFKQLPTAEMNQLIVPYSDTGVKKALRSIIFQSDLNQIKYLKNIKTLTEIPILDLKKSLLEEKKLFPTEYEKDVNLEWRVHSETLNEICKKLGYIIENIPDLYLDESSPAMFVTYLSKLKDSRKFTRKDDFADYLVSKIQFRKIFENQDGSQRTGLHEAIPKEIISAVFSHPETYSPSLPRLSHISNTPLLINGELLSSQGYHLEHKVLIKEQYSENTLPTNKLADFLSKIPFECEASRDNFLGAMINSIFLLYDFAGRFPALIFNAEGPNSGKTSTAKSLAYLIEGIPISTTSFKDDSEMEKELATKTKNSNAIIFDNIRQQLISSPLLERCLTDELLEFRIFRTQESMTRKNSVQFMFTMNNGSLSPDLTSRCIFIQLSRDKMIDPKFIPENFVKVHRNEIILELIGMIKKFLKKPIIHTPSTQTRFPEWAELVNSILVVNGFNYFLKNSDQMKVKFDSNINLILNTILSHYDGSILEKTSKDICDEISRENHIRITPHSVGRKLTALINNPIEFSSQEGTKYTIKISKLPNHRAGGSNSIYRFEVTNVIYVNDLEVSQIDREELNNSLIEKTHSDPLKNHNNHDLFLEPHQVGISPDLFKS